MRISLIRRYQVMSNNGKGKKKRPILTSSSSSSNNNLQITIRRSRRNAFSSRAGGAGPSREAPTFEGPTFQGHLSDDVIAKVLRSAENAVVKECLTLQKSIVPHAVKIMTDRQLHRQLIARIQKLFFRPGLVGSPEAFYTEMNFLGDFMRQILKSNDPRFVPFVRCLWSHVVENVSRWIRSLWPKNRYFEAFSTWDTSEPFRYDKAAHIFFAQQEHQKSQPLLKWYLEAISTCLAEVPSAVLINLEDALLEFRRRVVYPGPEEYNFAQSHYNRGVLGLFGFSEWRLDWWNELQDM